MTAFSVVMAEMDSYPLMLAQYTRFAVNPHPLRILSFDGRLFIRKKY